MGEYRNDWYGNNSTPRQVGESILREHPYSDVVFVLVNSHMFGVAFKAYFRPVQPCGNCGVMVHTEPAFGRVVDSEGDTWCLDFDDVEHFYGAHVDLVSDAEVG